LDALLNQQGEQVTRLKWALSQLHTNQLASKKKEKEMAVLLEQKDRELFALRGMVEYVDRGGGR
jgi:hypothetical protein